MSLLPDTGSVELRSYADYAVDQLAQKKRLDGRSLGAVRSPQVVREVYTEGDGLLSSVLFTDDSGRCVNAAVHGVFGPPWPDAPRQGRLNIHVTAPLLMSRMEGGGLFSRGQVLSSQQEEMPLRVAEGYVREILTSCLDMEKLCVLEGEACWVLTVTLTCLHVDGGLRAACLHAAVAALHGLVLPKARLPNGESVEAIPVELRRTPVAGSYGVHISKEAGEMRLVADPNAIEEFICETGATVAVDEYDSVVDVQLYSPIPLQPTVLLSILEQWSGMAAEFREALLKGL